MATTTSTGNAIAQDLQTLLRAVDWVETADHRKIKDSAILMADLLRLLVKVRIDVALSQPEHVAARLLSNVLIRRAWCGLANVLIRRAWCGLANVLVVHLRAVGISRRVAAQQRLVRGFSLSLLRRRVVRRLVHHFPGVLLRLIWPCKPLPAEVLESLLSVVLAALHQVLPIGLQPRGHAGFGRAGLVAAAS
jgi:hypothetical protein